MILCRFIRLPSTQRNRCGMKGLCLPAGYSLLAGLANLSSLSQAKVYSFLSVLKLIVLVTSTGLAAYSLIDFVDGRADGSVSGLLYNNNAIQNCSVELMAYTKTRDQVGQEQWSWEVRTVTVQG